MDRGSPRPVEVESLPGDALADIDAMRAENLVCWTELRELADRYEEDARRHLTDVIERSAAHDATGLQVQLAAVGTVHAELWKAVAEWARAPTTGTLANL